MGLKLLKTYKENVWEVWVIRMNDGSLVEIASRQVAGDMGGLCTQIDKIIKPGHFVEDMPSLIEGGLSMMHAFLWLEYEYLGEKK